MARTKQTARKSGPLVQRRMPATAGVKRAPSPKKRSGRDFTLGANGAKLQIRAERLRDRIQDSMLDQYPHVSMNRVLRDVRPLFAHQHDKAWYEGIVPRLYPTVLRMFVRDAIATTHPTASSAVSMKTVLEELRTKYFAQSASR